MVIEMHVAGGCERQFRHDVMTVPRGRVVIGDDALRPSGSGQKHRNRSEYPQVAFHARPPASAFMDRARRMLRPGIATGQEIREKEKSASAYSAKTQISDR